MGVFQNNLMGAAAAAASAGGGEFYSYQIANSLFFNGTSQALTKTWGSAASDNNKKAISVWIKRTGSTGTRSEIGETTNTKICSANDFNQLEINTNNPTGYSDQFHYSFNAGNNNNNFLPKWRDPSAWMHIIWIYNSDESTTTDRIKFYVNGVNYPIADTTYWNNRSGNPYPASGADTTFGKNGQEMQIARYVYNDAEWYGGQMADFIMIDGAASYTDFGELKNGVWIPKDPSGLTFGNNGFHLNFASSGDLGNDVSGNNNDFTNVGSIPASAQRLDSPTFNSDSNGGNFATYNPLTKGSYTDLSAGNLKADSNTGADASYPSGTMAFPSTGKWYYEQLIETKNSAYPVPLLVAFGDYGYNVQKGLFISMKYTLAGAPEKNTGANVQQFGTITLNSTGGVSFAAGDIMSWYIDMDNKKAWIAKNGTIPNSGDPVNGTNPPFAWTTNPKNGFTFGSQEYQTSSTILNTGSDGTFAGNKTAQGNSDDTGYGNFYYAPPTGFLALCTGNIPIADAINPALTSDDYPQKLFSPILYTGSGGTQTITGAGFQPDWTWIKNRGATADNVLMDSSRGAYASNDYYYLRSNTNAAEDHTTDFHNFASDGFIVGGTGSYFNASGNTFVGWNWRANGGSLTTNNEGSQTSYTQTDPSGAFSITKYAGTGSSMTVGHGLSIEPKLTIIKDRDSAVSWPVYTKIVDGSMDYFFLDTDVASGTSGLNGPNASVWNWQSVSGLSNTSGRNYIMYNFANVEGYCKVGTYIGNANDDGTFLYLGFKPAFFMCKPILTGNWRIQDTTRSPFNVADKTLFPNHSNATESNDSQYIDILSNGIKMRANDSNYNQATTFVYLAFAENPFKYATAR